MTPHVLVGLALTLLALAFVLYPLLRPAQRVAGERRDALDLEERRQAIYRQIVEIEFDQRVGKIGEADGAELTTQLLSEASRLLAQESTAARRIDEELEREIEAVRRALVASRQSEVEAVSR